MSEINDDSPNIVAGDSETIRELRDGTLYEVAVDPDDERFVRVTFRRPKAPNEKPVKVQGAERALGCFLKAAMTYAKGFGFARIIQRGGKFIGFVDYSAVLAQAGEDPSKRIARVVSIVEPTKH
jgi:hypothetical protein